MQKILAYIVGILGVIFGIIAMLFGRNNNNDDGRVQRYIERNRSIDNQLTGIGRETRDTKEALERARTILDSVKKRNEQCKKEP